MTIEKQASCADEQETTLLPVDQAIKRIEELLTPLNDDTECLPIRDCLQRVLGTSIQSPINVPTHTNSAMDGYAVKGSDIPHMGEQILKVIGVAYAGRPFDKTLNSGEAVRIMTGAAMPEASDTVIIQEDVGVDGDHVIIDGTTKRGMNVRHAGEDVKKDEVILLKGELLTAAHIGLLASLGIAKAQVVRKLRVAFFSTGDELRALDENLGTKELGKGEIYDSNRFTLYAMLKRLDVDLLDYGVVPDNPELIRATLVNASETADIVVTSGGVSVGDADFVAKILHEIGDIAFWKLAMRPGRPLACGKLNNALFFGLPGNPVAVMVTFYEFVQPAIRKMMACKTLQPFKFKVQTSTSLRKSSGRTEYQRGILYSDDDGETRVKSTGKQGAGRLSSMCRANCMIIIPPGSGSIESGDWVSVQPFQGLV